MSKNNLSYLVQYLLKENRISLDTEELDFQIQSHPSYPSLHSITGVLDHFGIENLALDVPARQDIIEQLPNCFMAKITVEETPHFVVIIKEIDALKVRISKKKTLTLSYHEFFELFSGIVLAVEADAKVPKESSSSIPKYTPISLGLISLTIILGATFYTTNNIWSLLIVLSSFLGIYLSLEIKKQEQGKPSVLGSAFCSNPSEKQNCNAVLGSKGATIYKDLKLSDLSLTYYGGLAIASILLILVQQSLDPLFIAIIAGLPITGYSIYYQAIVLKKWCPLCLGLVSVIWFQGIVALLNLDPTGIDLSGILMVTAALLAVASLWTFYYRIPVQMKELNTTKLEFQRFKRHFELFNSQLNNSRSISTHIEGIDEISYGNPNSSLKITMVSNPLCGHCKEVHKLINSITKSYGDIVHITLRFNVNPEQTEHPAVQITTRLLELYQNQPEQFQEAIDEIYGETGIDPWLEKWGRASEIEAYLNVLQEQKQWCQQHNINFTPEILINGRSYPRIYQRKDLSFFIEDLQQQALQETQNTSISLAKA